MKRRARQAFFLRGVVLIGASLQSLSPICPAWGAESTLPVTSASRAELAALDVAKEPAYPTRCKVGAGPAAARGPRELPPPTAEQLLAFQILRAESEVFEKAALDFQGQLGAIALHHFKDREKRLLTAIESEIKIESQSLNNAENEAILRLEAFLRRYRGPLADAKATPDAMFRLAALYDQRAKRLPPTEMKAWMSKALVLYRDVALDFPGYDHATSAVYYLGHAFRELGRQAESEQAFRALVCHNRYQLLPLEGSSDGIKAEALPQDHDAAFWQDWSDRNPLPLDQLGSRGNRRWVGVRDEELEFRDPYAECAPLPEPVVPGADPRYLAEVWWLLGNQHLYEEDRAGGPYRLNRAVSAYQHGLQFQGPKLRGLILQRAGWAHYRQQRYRASVRAFVEYLELRDKHPEESADIGDFLLKEIHHTIASALTYLDFDGPPPGDPYIPRRETIDVEKNPAAAERELEVAIQRVQDASIVPPNAPWAFDIHQALADQFVELGLSRNAIATLELTMRRFPLHPDAPLIVDRVARLHDELAALEKPGSPAQTEELRLALAARTALSRFVGDTEWTRANRENLEALLGADELSKVGLNHAAVDHTNAGRELESLAQARSDPGEQKELYGRASDEYALAGTAWAAFVAQDPNAPSAYESRFWLAFSRYSTVELGVRAGRPVSAEDFAKAKQAAADVRDSYEGDEHRVEAGSYVVGLADLELEAQYRTFEETQGTSGIPQRTQVTFQSIVKPSGVKKEVVEPFSLPAAVEGAVCARDEYGYRIPAPMDPEKVGVDHALDAAGYFFSYGQFAEARRRYYAIYRSECGKTLAGFKAWRRLLDMSNLEEKGRESRLLVDSKSCAIDEESRLAEEALRKPVQERAAYAEAKQLLEQAEEGSEAERARVWREAAAAYRVALEQAPDRDEAPEAAMNGAYAYKQVGEYDRAIEMYKLFVSKYGDKRTLAELAKTNQEKYKERVAWLEKAELALASAYVLFFDYAEAARKFDEISGNDSFPPETRKQAAKQALTLLVNLDDEVGVERAYKRFASLGASPEERAEAEFLLTSRVLRAWDPAASDSARNRAARDRVIAAMDDYYERNKRSLPALRFVVQAAYHAAVARRSAGAANQKTWWESTIGAFERYLAAAAPGEDGKSRVLGSVEAGMAAEADYTLVDQALKKEFDYESGHHRYKGPLGEVVKAYKADTVVAAKWEQRLQGVVERYGSQKWATLAIARQGSIYDSLRTGLYNTRPPELQMFTPAQERLLRRAEESGNEELIDQADAFRTEIRNLWRTNRDAQLERSDRYLVERYSTAIALARKYNLSDPALTRAIRRLAFMTEVVGEAKMAVYMNPASAPPPQGGPNQASPAAPSAAAPSSFAYSAGQFLRMRPGVYLPARDERPLPLPIPEGHKPDEKGAAWGALSAGRAAFDKGDLEGAQAQFVQAASRDPRSPWAHYALGTIFERKAKPEEAQGYYRKALEASPSFAPARASLALLLASTGRADQAARDLEQALRQSGDRAALWTALALVQGLAQRPEEATRAAREALKLSPDHRPAMVALARAQLGARQADLALLTLEGILSGFGADNPARDPKNAEAHLLRGVIHASRGQRGPAMADFEAALAVRNDLAPAHLYLAIYMLEAGNAEGALPHLEAAVRFDARSVPAHLALGDAYRLLGRIAEARRELEWVARARPQLAEPHYDLGLLFLTSGFVPGLTPMQAADKAIEHFGTYKLRAPRGGPDDVDELITRAKTKKAENEAPTGAGL